MALTPEQKRAWDAGPMAGNPYPEEGVYTTSPNAPGAYSSGSGGTGIGFVDDGLDQWDDHSAKSGVLGDRPVGGAIDTAKVANSGVGDFQLSDGSYVGPNASANAGIQGTQVGAYGNPQVQWGGEGGANTWANYGLGGMNNAQQGQAWSGKEGVRTRGPQAVENQSLSNQEAHSRGYDQAGSIQLAREAAMGQGPSEAGYMMQRGLDQSLAAQQAQMGSARGNAGIAMAGGNAAANSASLMNQTYGQAGQLRAQEMANARGLYGGLSGQQREQDQNRLQMGNQMSQFNAGLNDQYKLGMGALSNQFGNQANQWYANAQNPIGQQAQLDMQGHTLASGSQTSSNELEAGKAEAAKDRSQRSTDRLWSFAGTGLGFLGGMYGGQKH